MDRHARGKLGLRGETRVGTFSPTLSFLNFRMLEVFGLDTEFEGRKRGGKKDKRKRKTKKKQNSIIDPLPEKENSIDTHHNDEDLRLIIHRMSPYLIHNMDSTSNFFCVSSNAN